MNLALNVYSEDRIGLVEWSVVLLKAMKSITATSGKNGAKTPPKTANLPCGPRSLIQPRFEQLTSMS